MNNTYTRNDLADDLSKQLNIPVTQSKQSVEFILEKLTQVLAEDRKVEFRGFGVFVPRISKAKVGRNPLNPSAGTYTIPAKHVVRFRVGKDLNTKLNPVTA
jgi:integration host factor subunit beta